VSRGRSFARTIAREIRDRTQAFAEWLPVAASVEGRIHWAAVVRIQRGSRLEVGAASTVGRGAILAAKPGVLGPGSIRVGRGTSIGEYANLRTEGAELLVGDRCLVAQFVSLIATGHEFESATVPIAEQGVGKKAGVAIGDDVWIGAHSLVLPGVRVGRGAVVGGGSVVTADVPEYAVVVGNPARVVGRRS
jgi:acetyltransferase-like isoleucine patch superfamily enzyme